MNNDHFRGGMMKAVRNYPMSVLAPILMLGLCVGQDANSQAPRAHESARSQGDRDKVIYVSDFDLDAANFKQDKGGITGKGYLLPAPPQSRLRRKRQDPAAAHSARLRLREVKDGPLRDGGRRVPLRASPVRNIDAKEQWERPGNR